MIQINSLKRHIEKLGTDEQQKNERTNVSTNGKSDFCSEEVFFCDTIHYSKRLKESFTKADKLKINPKCFLSFPVGLPLGKLILYATLLGILENKYP